MSWFDIWRSVPQSQLAHMAHKIKNRSKVTRKNNYVEGSPNKKVKLRPARDIISRLRWSPGPLADDQIVFGYIDRMNGTMEKAVEDYIPACDGGDIPEHRILYFRRVVIVMVPSCPTVSFGIDLAE
mmetsp:Transcript_44772/g.93943  ORF Transcript_44772/g.93943 Transcript_44772/m.93943 type:complete len:126 (+) Transcript_44772:292-669(+)